MSPARSLCLVVVALFLSGCITPPSQVAPAQLERTVPASQEQVLSAAVRVLAQHGATVGTTDRTSGVVQTHPFNLEREWDGVPLTERVDCGRDMVGSEKAMMQPVTITLGVLTTPSEEGTVVRLKVTGSTYDRTAREMAGRNAVASAMSGVTSCTLKPAFVQQLLDEIASGAGASGATGSP